MIRALQLFALLSAFFVVAARCISAFPILTPVEPCAASESAVAARPSGDTPNQESPTVADLDDDSDDAGDALNMPARFWLLPVPDAGSAGTDRGASLAQRALPSHAQSLDRPPRA